MIVLDGVYAVTESGELRFHRVPGPSQTELQTLLNRVIQRVIRMLERAGLLITDPVQSWLELDSIDAMDTVRAASIRYRIAIGPHSGKRTLTLSDPAFVRTGKPTKALTADRDGFSLNAAVSCSRYQRHRLERLCRYITRPAICLDRLKIRSDGQIQYELKHPFRNGTTHSLYSPLDFLSKLAALVPRPRYHLVRYHGIFAPNSKMRNLVVPGSSQHASKRRVKAADQERKTGHNGSGGNDAVVPLTWAERLKRVFNIDVNKCPLCGGTLRIISEVTEPHIIQKILDHIEAQPPPPIAIRSNYS